MIASKAASGAPAPPELCDKHQYSQGAQTQEYMFGELLVRLAVELHLRSDADPHSRWQRTLYAISRNIYSCRLQLHTNTTIRFGNLLRRIGGDLICWSRTDLS